MRRTLLLRAGVVACSSVLLAGCQPKLRGDWDPAWGSPPPAEVEHAPGPAFVHVDHPEQFPLATAIRRYETPKLDVTGVVSADISRNVPVISIASGRIVEIRTRLGDIVTKGQILMRVLSSDITSAFSEYQQAVADEKLAQSQLDRSKILYDKGALAQKDLEVVQNAEEKADVAVDAAAQHLRVLGADKDHPNPVIDITAPISGVITDQQVTTASGTQGLASPNAFTISDLSHVWILCDVYENNLALVHVGEFADIRLNAYPDQVFRGQISNIGAILDPNTRTAKVRIEVENPGLMRLGMFVKATFHGRRREMYTVVPASAILHLHDRDWAFVDSGGNMFRRVEVHSGQLLSPGQQEILTGLQPGDRVVRNALDLQYINGQ
jgi:cobalt-zinc-cadmium efflux system membrane fusion protein